MASSVHAALIGGPSYDPLYERLDNFTARTGMKVEVDFTGDRPALNAHLAECDSVPYDLVSIHSKYAPSQLHFLAPPRRGGRCRYAGRLRAALDRACPDRRRALRPAPADRRPAAPLPDGSPVGGALFTWDDLLHAARSVTAAPDRFAVCPYLEGPSGNTLAYGGEHTFALTPRGIDKEGAVQLLCFLTAPEQQLLEARRGAVPPRRSVMHRVQSEASGAAHQRWNALDAVDRA